MNGRTSVQGDFKNHDWAKPSETQQNTRSCTWGGMMLCICMVWKVTGWAAALLKRRRHVGGCWIRAINAESSQYGKLACIGRSIVSRLKQPLFLSLGVGEATPGILHPVLHADIVQTAQQRGTGMAREWSGASKDRLRELGLFSMIEETGEWSNDSLKISEG